LGSYVSSVCVWYLQVYTPPLDTEIDRDRYRERQERDRHSFVC